MKYSAPTSTPESDATALCLGRLLRQRRTSEGLSLRELGERSGVSERFLVDVEGGKANVSIRRLADIAAALGTRAGLLLDAAEREVEHGAALRSIALVGLRGAGKTTLGKRLAAKLRLAFVELDERIAEAAGMSLSTLFEVHGEAHFRELERRTLEHVLARESPCVLATSGSIVTDDAAYSTLRERTLTVWLRASPEDHLARVEAQGDRRPMQGRPRAMAELRDILKQREPLYARAAHRIDTSGVSVARATAALEELAKA